MKPIYAWIESSILKRLKNWLRNRVAPARSTHKHRTVPVLRLMTEYYDHPLWRDEGFDDVGPFDPAQLGLSPELYQALMAWKARYDAQCNLVDFEQSQWFTEAEAQAFALEGYHLWLLLRDELDSRYEIWYFSERQGIVFQDPVVFLDAVEQ